MRVKTFRSITLVGIAAFVLGACSLMNDGGFSDDDLYGGESVSENTDLALPEYTADEMVFNEKGDYLVDQFSRTSAQLSDPNDVEDTGDMLALSRPAGQKAFVVKGKPAQVQQEPVVAEEVFYTTQQVPERVVISMPQPTSVTKTLQTSTHLEVTSPEEEPCPVAETVAAEPETVETVSAATEIMGDPILMVPLKKVRKTITETTTKVQKEVQTYDFDSMTLAERVQYGESLQDWDANAGDTLRGLLMKWGYRSGWTVVWKLDRDYHLEAGVIFRGSFTDVSAALIRSFARATPAPIGTFYQGNRVLVVSTQEDENER